MTDCSNRDVLIFEMGMIADSDMSTKEMKEQQVKELAKKYQVNERDVICLWDLLSLEYARRIIQ